MSNIKEEERVYRQLRKLVKKQLPTELVTGSFLNVVEECDGAITGKPFASMKYGRVYAKPNFGEMDLDPGETEDDFFKTLSAGESYTIESIYDMTRSENPKPALLSDLVIAAYMIEFVTCYNWYDDEYDLPDYFFILGRMAVKRVRGYSNWNSNCSTAIPNTYKDWPRKRSIYGSMPDTYSTLERFAEDIVNVFCELCSSYRIFMELHKPDTNSIPSKGQRKMFRLDSAYGRKKDPNSGKYWFPYIPARPAAPKSYTYEDLRQAVKERIPEDILTGEVIHFMGENARIDRSYEVFTNDKEPSEYRRSRYELSPGETYTIENFFILSRGKDPHPELVPDMVICAFLYEFRWTNSGQRYDWPSKLQEFFHESEERTDKYCYWSRFAHYFIPHCDREKMCHIEFDDFKSLEGIAELIADVFVNGIRKHNIYIE